MERCPVCGDFLTFKMEYNCGQPVIMKDCVRCGYVNLKMKTYTTNTIDLNTQIIKMNNMVSLV